jgi:hypothetical protein
MSLAEDAAVVFKPESVCSPCGAVLDGHAPL